MGVVYYSLCIYIVFRDTDESELRAPPNPRRPDKRGLYRVYFGGGGGGGLKHYYFEI